MHAENYPTVKDNRKILDKLPGKTYTINAIDQIPADCKYPATLISLAQNKKQPETGGLANRLELKVGAKVMVTVNVDIQDMLINGQIGEVAGFEIMNSIVKKFCLKFQDPLVGRTECCLTILLNKIVLYHYKNVMQIYQFVNAPYHLASSEHNFHLCYHGHVPYIQY